MEEISEAAAFYNAGNIAAQYFRNINKVDFALVIKMEKFAQICLKYD